MLSRRVTIRLTNKIVGSYEARSYPDDDADDDGFIELYKVPTYEIRIEGHDPKGRPVKYVHRAPRFMPYFNDPKALNPHYGTKGWVNAGLSSARHIVVSRYKADYEVQNRYSPGKGAIVLKGAFYIHGGPASDADYGFGSAGCVEIIGNYDEFKAHIAELSGLKLASPDDAITRLVRDGHLHVVIEAATVPDIRKAFTRKVS